MKLGDKKQVVVLGVVAVLAIGFLASQLMPKGPRLLASATPEPTKKEVDVEVVTLPLEVSGNPFSHAKLAPDDSQQQEGEGIDGEIKPVAPDLEGFPVGSPEYEATMWEWEKNKKPDENAGKPRKEEEKDPFNLKFTGYVGGSTPMAFIEVRGGTGVPFGEGEQIEPGVYLLAIHERSVEIRIAKKVVTLGLGEELKK